MPCMIVKNLGWSTYPCFVTYIETFLYTYEILIYCCFCVLRLCLFIRLFEIDLNLNVFLSVMLFLFIDIGNTINVKSIYFYISKTYITLIILSSYSNLKINNLKKKFVYFRISEKRRRIYRYNKNFRVINYVITRKLVITLWLVGKKILEIC